MSLCLHHHKSDLHSWVINPFAPWLADNFLYCAVLIFAGLLVFGTQPISAVPSSTETIIRVKLLDDVYASPSPAKGFESKETGRWVQPLEDNQRRKVSNDTAENLQAHVFAARLLCLLPCIIVLGMIGLIILSDFFGRILALLQNVQFTNPMRPSPPAKIREPLRLFVKRA